MARLLLGEIQGRREGCTKIPESKPASSRLLHAQDDVQIARCSREHDPKHHQTPLTGGSILLPHPTAPLSTLTWWLSSAQGADKRAPTLAGKHPRQHPGCWWTHWAACQHPAEVRMP